MAIQQGQMAPDFSLFNTEKNKVGLADYKGKNLVILFFPLAFTGVCTTELCSVRDNLNVYTSLNADVVGISNPKNAAPNPKSSAVCKIIKIVTKYALPIKYAETEIGRPRKRFKVPNSRSIGIVIANC